MCPGDYNRMAYTQSSAKHASQYPLKSPDTHPRNAPRKPVNARNGAQALAHNFGIHITPPIIPEGDFKQCEKTKE